MVTTNFQLLMLSPNFLKFKIPYDVCVCWGGGGFGDDQFPTFIGKFKSAKILKNLY